MTGVRALLLATACLATLPAGTGCRAAERTPLPAESAPDGWRSVALTTLAGRTWMLREWDAGDPAPAEPRITLRYDDGRFTGRSGCNRYNAAVGPGSAPDSIRVGAVAATRMMCPEPAAALEGRFLAALPRAQAIRLRDGRLGVTYAGPNGVATLIFDEIRAAAN
jgi:heat shock protein HslJ